MLVNKERVIPKVSIERYTVSVYLAKSVRKSRNAQVEIDCALSNVIVKSELTGPPQQCDGAVRVVR